MRYTYTLWFRKHPGTVVQVTKETYRAAAKLEGLEPYDTATSHTFQGEVVAGRMAVAEDRPRTTLAHSQCRDRDCVICRDPATGELRTR